MIETRSVLTKLKQKRKSLGFSQYYVASRLGVDVSKISLLENGLRRLSISDFLKIAEILGEKPEYFLGDIDSKLVDLMKRTQHSISNNPTFDEFRSKELKLDFMEKVVEFYEYSEKHEEFKKIFIKFLSMFFQKEIEMMRENYETQFEKVAAQA